MTVYMVISLPKIPYIHCIFRVLAKPTLIALTFPFTANDQGDIC